jgi:hypothetical protein
VDASLVESGQQLLAHLVVEVVRQVWTDVPCQFLADLAADAIGLSFDVRCRQWIRNDLDFDCFLLTVHFACILPTIAYSLRGWHVRNEAADRVRMLSSLIPISVEHAIAIRVGLRRIRTVLVDLLEI